MFTGNELHISNIDEAIELAILECEEKENFACATDLGVHRLGKYTLIGDGDEEVKKSPYCVATHSLNSVNSAKVLSAGWCR